MMQIDLLKNIAASFAGDKARGIVEILQGKKNVDEFLIAKKLNITVNQTRNILYKLADEGLVSFTKKKDSKKGGWYKYSWSLNEQKSLLKAKEALSKSIEVLDHQFQIKKNDKFYACPNGDMELNEENALLHNYTCSECGEILQMKDNSKEVQSIEKELQSIEKEVTKMKTTLSTIDSELDELRVKQEKSSLRKHKLEEKKKEKEKLAKKVARASSKKKGKKA